MNKYRVKGELIVAIPYDLTVRAYSPVEAESVATNAAKTSLAAERCLVADRRPENVSVTWVGED